MDVGMIGLGRMGANMARRLLRAGHRVVGYDRERARVAALVQQGGVGAKTLEAVVSKLEPPRAVWLMLPANEPTEQAVETLADWLVKRDLLIDGGNSFYKDSIRRAAQLASAGIAFVDVGTSGGLRGLERGYCLMVGGEASAVRRLQPLFKSLAAAGGYLHVGPSGAGHFVKMVHNGIEYGMLQAYAEGLSLLRGGPYRLELGRIAHLWNQGSVIRSWLLELAERALARDPDLRAIAGYVEDSGEGRWTVQEAVAFGVPLPIISGALFSRFRSRATDPFSDKVVAALRREFGGHAVKPTKRAAHASASRS